MAAKPEPQPLLLVNIGQLLTLRSASGQPGPRRGVQLRDLGMVEGGAVLCVGGNIVATGRSKDLLRHSWVRKNRKRIREIDCSGKVVLPGFIDSHTHPAFVAPRLVDFEKRIGGATYEEIAAAGGGIRSSVEGVREAGLGALAAHVTNALELMASQGTTTVEAKSGYGLSLEAELKSLKAIGQSARRWPGTVVPTLLGAHVVPWEFQGRSQKYVEAVCKEMIPTAVRQRLAVFVDVFTERGAFTSEETEAIFQCATQHGLGVRGHIGQLSQISVWPLLKYQPASLDHLDHVSDDDIRALAKHETVATLVPGANYFLGLGRFAPARQLIDAGVTVALATDYNPGSSPTSSMPFVLSLACTHMKMSPEEVITAATINGAQALRLSHRKGSIEPGKDADITAFSVQDYREIAYWFASNLCSFTVLNGTVKLIDMCG